MLCCSFHQSLSMPRKSQTLCRGLVRVALVLGDRRGHFESVKDVWEIFRIVSQERKRREIDPTLRVLQECVGELKKSGAGGAYTRERLEEMLEFLSTTAGLFEE